MTASLLAPQPGDVIDVEQRRFRFAAHPAAPRNVYALEASRATVYQVLAENGAQYALKVFKKRFRLPVLVDITARLPELQSLPGLLAAERWIVTSPPSGLSDLQFAVFIPWVRGATWADLLVKARRGAPLRFDQAVRLCDRFLLVIEMLQSHGIAHTDLSPANVVFDMTALDVQLVDLEDIYMTTATQPSAPSRGSRGYQHPGGESCWSAEGDRYSSAVLAAEILLSVDAEAMRFATDEHCFGPNTKNSADLERSMFLRHRLRLISGTFASLFDRAWESNGIADCPTAAELRQAIQPLIRQVDVGIGWEARVEKPKAPPRPPVPSRPALPVPPPPVPVSPSTGARWGAILATVAFLVLILIFVLLFVLRVHASPAEGELNWRSSISTDCRTCDSMAPHRKMSVTSPSIERRRRGIMDLESARGMKQELHSFFASRPQDKKFGTRRRKVSLGLAPGATPSDYRIAVRAASENELPPDALDLIRSRTREPVDVRYTGKIVPIGSYAQSAVRGPAIGASVARKGSIGGTLGFFARRDSDRAIGFVSNNHILAGLDHGGDGDEILHPAPSDKDAGPATVIGHLAGDYPRLKQPQARVDCAFARLIDGLSYDPGSLEGGGTLSATPAAEYADPDVCKIGRTTGLTYGRVSAFELESEIVYDFGPVRFPRQIEIQPAEGAASFSCGGDSGSLVFTRSGWHPVGLVFACSPRGGPGNCGLTYANAIDEVLTALGVTLLA